MNVLLALRDWSGIGGSQTWGRTVAAELERRGHVVCTNGPNEQWPESFGLGIFSHGKDTRTDFDECDFVINVSHGLVEPERPVPGADVYVFVSEECRDHWFENNQGSIDWVFDPPHPQHRPKHVIRQPIDTEFWCPGSEAVGLVSLGTAVKQPYILRYSYYGGLYWLPDVCRSLGYGLHHVKDATPEEAREWMRGAACVISSGRGVLEAMSCGRPTILADWRFYDDEPMGDSPGDNIKNAHTNYSGRGRQVVTVDWLEQCLRLYLGGYGGQNQRSWVTENHDARKIVDQLLALVPKGQEA